VRFVDRPQELLLPKYSETITLWLLQVYIEKHSKDYIIKFLCLKGRGKSAFNDGVIDKCPGYNVTAELRVKEEEEERIGVRA
jgi:hypothetical protein